MFSILGTGSCLPKLKVTNDDLTSIVDTSDEWIVQKTGIKSRHIITDESITDLAFNAANSAFENAKIKASDIDLIICATVIGDTVTPSMACLLAERLGVACTAFDINAACSGFIYALDVVAGYFVRGRAKKALVIGAEHLSRHINWKDRATCVLFGDGAGAVVLGEGDGLLSIRLTTQPNSEHLAQNFTGGESPFNKRDYGTPYVKMHGQDVYRFAVNAVANDLVEVLNDANLQEKDVQHFLLHQANIRIIDAAINSLKFPKEKFFNTIDKTGNLSAASVPVLIDEANRAGRLKKGDIIAMCAFGAGLTTGACVIRW